MNVLRVLPGLALLLLGAHFLRGGSFLAIGLTIALMVLLFVRQPWTPRVLQTGLVLGALEWVRTLLQLVQMRQTMGQPYERLVVILGAVAMFTALSALIFECRAVREHYRGAIPPAEA